MRPSYRYRGYEGNFADGNFYANHPFSQEASLGYQLGAGLKNHVFRPGMRTSDKVWSQHPILSAGMTGAAGAGLGYSVGSLLDWWRGSSGGGNLGTTLGLTGLLGGSALGGLFSLNRRREYPDQTLVKTQSVKTASSDLAYIKSQLRSDRSTPAYEKRRLMDSLSQLSGMELGRLRRLLSTTAGSAAGALISRFLFGAGWPVTAAAAVAGGLAGRYLGTTRTYDGKKPMPTSSYFG